MIRLPILIVIISSIFIALTGFAGTAQTPSQEAFEVGLPSTLPGPQTPTQQTYELHNHTIMTGSGTPSQQVFSLRGSEATLGTETPSQLTFERPPNRSLFKKQVVKVSPLSPNGIIISKILKEGGSLFITVANNVTNPVNLTNWKLELNNGTVGYTLPNFILQPTSLVNIHSNKGSNTTTDLFGSNFVWNGTRSVGLFDDKGNLVSYRIVTK